MSVTYTATLSVREETVLYLSSLLHAERLRRGTRTGTRVLGCFKQAVLVIRWFLDATRIRQLARDNQIGRSTAYDYLHEGIDVLAAQTPSLHSALLAAKAAGHSHVNIDGTLIATTAGLRTGRQPDGLNAELLVYRSELVLVAKVRGRTRGADDGRGAAVWCQRGGPALYCPQEAEGG
jgi:hypothetical protein